MAFLLQNQMIGGFLMLSVDKKNLILLMVSLLSVLPASLAKASEIAPVCERLMVGEKIDTANLDGEARDFFQTYWKAYLGKDSLNPETLEVRQLIPGAFEINEKSDSRTLRVSFQKGIISPRVQHTPESSSLVIPEGYRFSETKDQGQDVLQRLTVYSNLHPYTAVARDQVNLKRVQQQAVDAVDIVAKSHSSSFLFVAPTGVGKTIVMMRVLKKRLHSEGNTLHIVVADQNFITDQLHSNIKRMMGEVDFNLDLWGDGKSKEITGYLREIEKRNKPTVLVTTIQTLNSRLRSGWGEKINMQSLRQLTSTFAFDEAHHLGAPETVSTLNALKENNKKLFLYGTTATPAHLDQSILRLFDSSFWAYLDKPDSFLENGQLTPERLIGNTVKQFIESVKQGELSPIESLRVVKTADENGSFFIKKKVEGDGVRYIIDPARYAEFLEKTKDSFLIHNKGFITVGTVAEANSLMEFLNSQNLGKKFAALHTGLPNGEQKKILRSFKSKSPDSPNFLITIRKMDEGVDIPAMSLYIDANRTVGPRQFLQRLGRVVRLAPNKQATDVLVFSEVTELSLIEGFHDIQKATIGKLDPEITPQSFARTKIKSNGQFEAAPDTALALELIQFMDITARIDGGLGRTPMMGAPATSSEQSIYAGLAAIHRGDKEKLQKFYDMLPGKLQAMVRAQFYPAKSSEQWAKVTDRFIEDSQRAPEFTDSEDGVSLTEESQHYIALKQILASNKGLDFWRSLSDLSRKVLRDSGMSIEMMTIDQLLNEFVDMNHRLPSAMYMHHFRDGKAIPMDEAQARYEEALYGKFYRAITYGEIRLSYVNAETRNLIQASRIYADFVRSLPSQVSAIERSKHRTPSFGVSSYENRVFRRIEMALGLAPFDPQLQTSVERTHR
jgi:superfamily II DNA or RNA helicase